MKPTDFPERTALFAEDQDEYLTLPAFSDGEQVISCWRFTWWERIRILFGSRLWLRQYVFGEKLQPQLPQIDRPFKNKTT